MLNILTKYSTMVTSGSTGSTTHVPVMPRAKGFCITTHKQTQEARKKQLFLLVHLRGNKKVAAFNSAPPCALRAVDITRSAKWPLRQRKKICCTSRRAVSGGHFQRQFHTEEAPQATKKLGLFAWRKPRSKTTEFLLLPTCPTPTVDDALPTCHTPTTDDV